MRNNLTERQFWKAQVRDGKSKRMHAMSDAMEMVRQTVVFSGLMAGLVGLFVVIVRAMG